jgi:hypothetical protein
MVVVAVAVAVGLVAAGCGGTSSGSPSAPVPAQRAAAPPGSASSDVNWLTAKAEPWNHTLNQDQTAIDVATTATSTSDSKAYFTRLGTACQAMLEHADKAQFVPAAPSSSLTAAWAAMISKTKAYAAVCVTLTRTHSNADLLKWRNSLAVMNSANGKFNTAVAAVRKQTSG